MKNILWLLFVFGFSFPNLQAYRFESKKMQLNIEWDPEKANNNKKKHKINFELAATIFNDKQALSLFDHEHSDSVEERWITLGLSPNGNLLVVVHTYNEINNDLARIRIISARKATEKESLQYIKGE